MTRMADKVSQSDSVSRNGFVARPEHDPKRGGRGHIGDTLKRLMATADNGMAIPWRSTSAGKQTALLRRRGFRFRAYKTAAGYVAWCERIEGGQ